MTLEDGQRIAVLEADMKALKGQVGEIKNRMDQREAVQDNRHQENSGRLSNIEKLLAEFTGAFKVGRLMLNLLWGLGGSVAGLLFAKWIGIKP